MLGNAFNLSNLISFIFLLKFLITKIENIDHGVKENNAIVIPITPAVAGTVINIPAIKPIYEVDFLKLVFLIIARKNNIRAIPLRK